MGLTLLERAERDGEEGLGRRGLGWDNQGRPTGAPQEPGTASRARHSQPACGSGCWPAEHRALRSLCGRCCAVHGRLPFCSVGAEAGHTVSQPPAWLPCGFLMRAGVCKPPSCLVAVKSGGQRGLGQRARGEGAHPPSCTHLHRTPLFARAVLSWGVHGAKGPRVKQAFPQRMHSARAACSCPFVPHQQCWPQGWMTVKLDNTNKRLVPTRFFAKKTAVWGSNRRGTCLGRHACPCAGMHAVWACMGGSTGLEI